MPPQERGIGFVFQHYAAFKHMTVRDNVAFGLTIRKRPKDEIKATRRRAARDRRPRRLPRPLPVAALAAASASAWRSPARWRSSRKVLLLDEPFGALDAKVRAELRAWLRRLHDEVHVTTVLVTHDQEEAMEITDRIAVMDHGVIEQVGAPRELYDQPANDVRHELPRAGHRGRRRARAPARPVGARSSRATARVEAQVSRVVHLGFEVRVELELADGGAVSVQLTRGEAEQLELAPGDIV